MKNKHHFTGFSVHHLAMSKNGTRKMKMYGCDDRNHAVWTATEWLDADGKVTYAEDHGVEVIGKCTGTCKGKTSVGGFIHVTSFKLQVSFIRVNGMIAALPLKTNGSDNLLGNEGITHYLGGGWWNFRLSRGQQGFNGFRSSIVDYI